MTFIIVVVIFTVLMLFWLFSGYSITQPNPPGWALAANSFIPWLCVLLVALVAFGVIGPSTTLPR